MSRSSRRPTRRRGRWRPALAAAGLVLLAGAGALGAWLYTLDTVVVEKFSGRRWDFPSRIYGEPFLIYPGLDLAAAGIDDRLRRLAYRTAEPGAPLRKGDYRRTSTALELALHDEADPSVPADARTVRLTLAPGTGVVTAMTDGQGAELFALQLEPEVVSGLYDAIWEERREATLDELPPLLVRAVTLVEDRRFFDHFGIDPVGIVRAALTNLREGAVVQGGSTLTQQLMKNFFLSEARTWQRKGVEAAMAVVAERRYSKEEILTAYLNEIYLGQNGIQGVFGVWEASRFYFGRPPGELSVGEIALLAGMIRAPNATSPFRAPTKALARRAVVLGLLRDDGAIDEAQYAAALAEPLRPAPPQLAANAAPYFVDFLRAELESAYAPELLTSRGLGIETSFDLQLQQAAVAAVRDGLAALERRYPRLARDPARPLQAALIAVRPQTGGIVAMVGGRDYGSSQFNRATSARRQPGSVFKPFVYLAAFEAARAGHVALTPATRISDAPFDWLYDSRRWRPANYGDRYLGEVSVRTALEQSLNAATARLARDVGLEAVCHTAERAGLGGPLPAVPSVVLGAAEATPFEVAQAYAVLANQGLRAEARAATKVVDRRGQLVERHALAVERVASPEATFIVTHLMRGVLDRGTGAGARERGFTRPAAGKTGTTNEARDAWFAGFTPDLVAVVWVGFDDNAPLGLTGAQAAVPIWTAFMRQATAATPPADFVPPDGVALVRIDPYTGGVATGACPDVFVEAFLRDQQPTGPCPAHPDAPLASVVP